jgi:hypothetical protein
MVCSSSRLLGLFHPKATSEIHLSGVFPTVEPPHLIDVPFPHAISKEFLSWSYLHNASPSLPQLQGFDPNGDP